MTDEVLSLFPLHTVLFPGMPLPLHIFEERYKQMIGACIEEKRPFGVVLIRSGPEVGGVASPHLVGTTAEIVSVRRLPEGRINLIAMGRDRFRIREIVQEHPFLIGRVEPLPDRAASPPVALVREVRELLSAYVSDLLALLDQQQEVVELPDEAEGLSMVAASVLQISVGDRQRLLEMTDIADRLEREREWLSREAERIHAMLGAQTSLATAKRLEGRQLLDRVSLN